jgi:hypothetical protein
MTFEERGRENIEALVMIPAKVLFGRKICQRFTGDLKCVHQNAFDSESVLGLAEHITIKTSMINVVCESL